MTRKRSPVQELLVLECFEEDLSEVQAEKFKKAEQEIIEFRRKFDRLNQNNKVTSNAPPIAVSGQSVTQPAMVMPNSQPHQNNIIMLEPNVGAHLVMSTTGSPQPPISGKNTATRFPTPATSVIRTPRILAQPRVSGNTAIRAKVLPTTKLPIIPEAPPSTSGITKIQLKPPPTTTETLINLRPLKSKVNPQTNDVVDLTDDDNIDSESGADQKEVAIGKVSEKTFPSLVVTVRVCLRAKDIPVSVANNERNQLDARVKRVLMLTPTSFTEWLLQQGLLKCEQLCAFHRGPNGRFNNLKLGMYSDVTKFPYSGGYIWISECCPTTFVSVFSGSLFEGAPHPPTILLKLIYHWACQTIVQNVLQWVKVDNLYIKTMYTNLRAVCTAAIHEKYGKLGGYKKTIEVGVISLGTTTQDGQMKHIKVEVLGVLETDTKRIRLKALEPLADDRQFMKKKFMKILEPLQQWVDKDSLIVTDYTVDRATCLLMGFNYIVQNSHGIASTPEQPTNQAIMEYLRKVIPKMFQNTLSLLSRQIIQQFLDELVWRETWGPIPSRAFDSIIQHISEQTRLDSGGSLMHRLARIAANPLKNWKYDKWATNCKAPLLNCAGKSKDSSAPVEDHASQLERALLNCTTILPAPVASSSTSEQSNQTQTLEAAMIALEPYYYGTLPGDPKLANEKFLHSYFKCIMCKDEFKLVMKFTDHLISHAFNKNVRDNADTKELCKLCLKICPKTNNQNLNTHRLQVHSDRQTCRTLCKICSVKHKDAASLQSHMISSHCELDMPYHCEICKFRTSILDKIHHHFNTAHCKGTRGYCPYCLKVMQFARPDGTDLETNQLRFVHHIQKHQLTVNRKCEKCLLNFTNRSILKEHQDVWHQSCKQLEDVERCTMEECTLMAAPLIDPLPSSTSTIDNSCKGTLKFNFDYSKERCCECDGNFNPEHFVGHMMCTKCRFTTCCNNSMKEHTALVHGTSLLHLRPPVIGRAPTFDNPLYCPCGYTTRHGNYMANHLVECGNNMCYINKRKFEEIKIKIEEDIIPINDVMAKDDWVMMTDKQAMDGKGSSESQSAASLILNPSLLPTATSIDVSHPTDNLLPKFNTSNTATINEVKEENLKMAVDIEDADDRMECDDLEDSMTVDDSSSEAMVLD